MKSYLHFCNYCNGYTGHGPECWRPRTTACLPSTDSRPIAGKRILTPPVSAGSFPRAGARITRRLTATTVRLLRYMRPVCSPKRNSGHWSLAIWNPHSKRWPRARHPRVSGSESESHASTKHSRNRKETIMSEVTVTPRHVRAVVTMRRIRLADLDVSRVRAGHAARATETAPECCQQRLPWRAHPRRGSATERN